MVHNDDLIGGRIDNMIGEFSDHELGTGNHDSSFYVVNSPPNDDHVALLQQIQSRDLIALEGTEFVADLDHYDESYIASPNNILADLPRIFVKKTIDTFPNLEEHDQGALNFELVLNPGNNAKGSWYYSSMLSKVFIRMDQTFYMEISYLSNSIFKNIHLRAMMVFLDDVGLPVTRCNNHKHSDPSVQEAEKESVIRTENSDCCYCGNAIGKNVNDRLSVLIPLSVSVTPDINNRIKQNIAYKFVCQNSCIGRRPTAIIFTLENENYVLAKRVVNVKICSCPKRDKEKEEKKTTDLKRTASEANLPPGKRPKIMKIKDEPDVVPTNPQSDNTADNDEEAVLEIRMPNKESMDLIVDLCFSQITKLMALDPSAKLTEYYKLYKKLIDNKNQNEYKRYQ